MKENIQGSLHGFEEDNSESDLEEKRRHHPDETEMLKGTHILPKGRRVSTEEGFYKTDKNFFETQEPVYCDIVRRKRFKFDCLIRIKDYLEVVSLRNGQVIQLRPNTELVVEVWNLVKVK